MVFVHQTKNTLTPVHSAKSDRKMTCYLKLDESSGDTVDYTGRNTFTNTGVTFGTGKINNCGIFDGASGTKIQSNNVDNFLSNSGYSISFWAYLSSVATRTYVSDSLNFRIDGNGRIPRLSLFNNGVQIGTTGIFYTISSNTWTHIVFTVNSISGCKMYADGTLVGSLTTLLPVNVQPDNLIIGNRSTDTNRFLGNLDEIGIFNYTLSQSEIDELYNSGTGKQPPFTFPISPYSHQAKNMSTFSNMAKNLPTMTAYWKLDESTGDAIDYVNGYVLTNTGVTYSSGKINNGALFDGSASGLTSLISTQPLNLFSPYNLTISAWFKRNSTGTGNRAILCQYGTVNRNIALNIGLGNLRCVRYDSDGNLIETVLYGTIITDDVWHHVVYTFDKVSGSNLYVDGSLVTTSSNVVIANIVPATSAIGYLPNIGMVGGISQQGLLDEVATFNTTLSQDDVTYLYNSTNGRQPPFDLVYTNFSNQSKNMATFTHQSKS